MASQPVYRDTTFPTKRSAPSDVEPHRLSRSMTAYDPQSRHFLLDNQELLPVPSSTRRRVNPESLAVRLGPELVAELERFVQPGVVEMPSFAVRQEIQKRFNVDRRHIYDWFHSKGLRVTKEDKRATVEVKTDAMRRVRGCAAPSLARSIRSQPYPTPSLKKPKLAEPASAVSPSPRAPLRTNTKVDEVTSRPQAWISAPADVVIKRIASTVAMPSRPPPGATRTLCDPHIDSVCSLYLDNPLDETQRLACYDALSRILGPAGGFQESVGSYSAYMATQTAIYYDALLGDFPLTSDFASPATSLDIALRKGDSGASTHALPYTADYDNHLPFENLADAILSFPDDDISSLLGDTFASSYIGSDTTLEIEDILASPILEDQPLAQPTRACVTKNVSFASFDRASLNYSATLLSSGKGFNPESSSLAGALGDFALSGTATADQDARKRGREWSRPRMGRSRAYSAGGGM